MPRTPVTRYRAAALALRGIRARDGKTAATTNAVSRHEETKADAVSTILSPDALDLAARHLVGLLVEEEQLAERLRTSPLPRPELKARVDAVRRELRSRAQGLG